MYQTAFSIGKRRFEINVLDRYLDYRPIFDLFFNHGHIIDEVVPCVETIKVSVRHSSFPRTTIRSKLSFRIALDTFLGQEVGKDSFLLENAKYLLYIGRKEINITVKGGSVAPTQYSSDLARIIRALIYHRYSSYAKLHGVVVNFQKNGRRYGLAITGDKGSGKTTALLQILRQFSDSTLVSCDKFMLSSPLSRPAAFGVPGRCSAFADSLRMADFNPSPDFTVRDKMYFWPQALVGQDRITYYTELNFLIYLTSKSADESALGDAVPSLTHYSDELGWCDLPSIDHGIDRYASATHLLGSVQSRVLSAKGFDIKDLSDFCY